MKVIDEEFLKYIRGLPCAFCDAPPPSQVHHINCRGMDGGARLDKALAVLPCCFFCHGKYQGDRKACFALVEQREGLGPGQAQAAVWRLLRQPKREKHGTDHRRENGSGYRGGDEGF